MYVICFYWQGDRWQGDAETENNKFQDHIDRVGKTTISMASKYVNHLYHGVKRFASKEFKFICFTNENLVLDNDIETRNMDFVTQRGVLPRLYMFSKESGLFGKQVLCLDIDVVIVGSLEKIMNYEGEFCVRSKFKLGEEYKLDGDIISFKAGQENENRFWKPFIKDIEKAEEITGGRERYWVRHVAGDIAQRWEDVAPGNVCSYKRHVLKKKKIPKNASIVSCHGFPRPEQIKDKWIKKYWK